MTVPPRPTPPCPALSRPDQTRPDQTRPDQPRPDRPRPELRALLGTRVTVTVSRPLGSAHPRHPDLIYPVNYGPVTGEPPAPPTDAYLLGWTQPVAQARGQVIAIIERLDSAGHTVVVARDGTEWTDDTIATLIRFQERPHRTRLIRTPAR